ncbi:MAG TPA: adenosylcobinamide amidohydrolase [Bryobacteraceae bacterium]|nr:adenosylcobinamide amidohydrolase [Bryobacteraceae bacterium]
MVTPPYRMEERERWLVARFAEPWAVASWAVVNGGWQRTDTVAWHYLHINEIAGVDDPADWMRGRMRAEGLSGAVGFMTSRRAGAWVSGAASDGDCRVWTVGTIGLSNALRAGDSSGPIRMPGTINLLVCCSQPLTMEAGMEALALASEAKALAMLESGVKSVRTGAAATGTGTDYLAMAWPVQGERTAYAGKHTQAGAAVGAAVYETVRRGAAEWAAEVGMRL